MHTSLSMAVIIAVVGTGVFHLAAQGPSEQWKEKHSVGERYEGIGFDPQTSAGVHMIAFMVRAEPDPRRAIEITRDDEIVIDFYSGLDASYVLTVRELDLSKHYWMEPKKPQNATRGINTFKDIWKTDVLEKLNADPRTRVSVAGLGALVQFDERAGVQYVAPAVMRAATAEPLRTFAGYRATFLPDVLFDDVSFSARPGCQAGNTSKPFPGGGSVGRQFPGSSFHVDLDAPTREEDVMLEIVTTLGTSRYCFTHPAAVR